MTTVRLVGKDELLVSSRNARTWRNRVERWTLGASKPSWTIQGDESRDAFGTWMDSLGVVDATGTPAVAIGATGHRFGERGYVRIVNANDGTTIRRIESDEDGSAFGYRLAAIGDLDGDARGDLVVCAWRSREAGTGSGKIQAFSGATGSVLHTVRGLRAHDSLGVSLVARR